MPQYRDTPRCDRDSTRGLSLDITWGRMVRVTYPSTPAPTSSIEAHSGIGRWDWWRVEICSHS
ncbi:hypothetical protein NKH18_50295 [Streptomyces sp. M10(2022)]